MMLKSKAVGSVAMRTFEKAVMLRALDHHWKEHLAVMDHLRQSVNLRGYAQKSPVQEYKRESFSMFTLLLETINIEMVKALCSVSIEQNTERYCKRRARLLNNHRENSSDPHENNKLETCLKAEGQTTTKKG